MVMKEKVSQKIAKELMSMIQTGQFSANSKLPSEMDLAKHFGVSRASIREALSVLTAVGIISSQQGGGNYIEEVDICALIDAMKIQAADIAQIKYLFEVRTVLETQAAYFAALRRTPEDLERLYASLKGLEAALLRDAESGLAEDIAFHRELIRATHNPVMIHVMDNLSDLYTKAMNITLNQNIGKRRKRQQVIKEHQAIYDAIEERQPELAKVQCAIHLENVKKKLDMIPVELDEI